MTEPLSEFRLGIGKVIDELSAEFPALSQSKIRYLEEQGLLDPERTQAGYRKYAYSDVERLRFVLHAQEQLFWPLSHIRQVLDDMDRGVVPDMTLSPTIEAPFLSLAEDGLPTPDTFVAAPSNIRLSREELLESGGIDDKTLDAIEEFGLIKRRPSQTYYDGEALSIASIVGELAQLGLDPEPSSSVGASAGPSARTAPQLIEPLSQRELDVLRLFRADLSGPEIACELVIALSTLRTHTKHIYSKLDVNSRRAAVNRAIELGLL